MIKSRNVTHPKPVPASRIGRVAVVFAVLLVLGCSQETPLSVSDAQAAVAEAPTTQETEHEPPTESAAQSYQQKLAAALEKAAAAKDAVVNQLSAASESGGQTASDSVAWATEMFNSLKEQGLTKAENTQQWLSNDWKLAGAWEYHVKKLDANADIESTLNQLGKERWECIQIVPSQPDEATTFYFKRPAESYLNHLPMKDLMHLLPLMGAGGVDRQ